MGGNRFTRTEFTDGQVIELFERYKLLANRYESLFSGKDKKTDKLWNYDLARHMTRESKGKLQHLINEYHGKVSYCQGCRNKMTLREHLETSNSYRRHCPDCEEKRVWATRSALGEEKLRARGCLISEKKKAWYKTDEGREVARMVGEINSTKMKAYNKTDAGRATIERNAVIASGRMRDRIAKGEFMPNITNGFTHWTAQITLNGEVNKFRSSWEACFWLCNRHLSYETYRIPYMEGGVRRTYIADFFDYSTNTLYEIKPSGRWVKEATKMNCVVDFCLKNNVKFIWLNERNILQYIDREQFNEDNMTQYNMLIKGLQCN